MKILLLPAYFSPEILAGMHLQNSRTEAFVKSGFCVDVFTPTPTRGISIDVSKKSPKVEILYGGKMKVRRFKMYKEPKNSVLRAFRYFLCSLRQLFYGVFKAKFDVLLLGSTPPIQGLFGGIIKKCRKKKLIYILQDIFPDSLVGTGLVRKGTILWKLGRIIENFTYKQADKIIVISNEFKRNLLSKGVPEDKIEVIYNWVDEFAIVPVSKEDNPLFEEFGINKEKFTVVYAGNLGHAQNIDMIVDAASQLNDIQFVIFGTGGLESELKQRKQKEGIDNLKIFPLQPYERVSQVYSLGDVCVVACKQGLGGAAMPSKTWSIMSAGRAVLANFDVGELKEIIEQNECGIYTIAGDLDGFVSAILRMAKSPQICEMMGQNGREYIVKNLTKEVGTEKYVNVVRSICKSN